MQVILSALLDCTDFVIPWGLSTLYRCSLTTVAQEKPYPEKPSSRDCCNHKWCRTWTLYRPLSTIAATISFWSFVRVSIQDNYQWIPCPREFQAHSIFMNSNSQPLATKASAVSIELTWLLEKAVLLLSPPFQVQDQDQVLNNGVQDLNSVLSILVRVCSIHQVQVPVQVRDMDFFCHNINS